MARKPAGDREAEDHKNETQKIVLHEVVVIIAGEGGIYEERERRGVGKRGDLRRPPLLSFVGVSSLTRLFIRRVTPRRSSLSPLKKRKCEVERSGLLFTSPPSS
ncbi:hypothetical protein ABB37_07695 [Leptomonas pyrrhocoris]|uniref:Uncharacterized protein n=1 Tax=Leptomonas pyrrhocoris TaxID=157538 RepID=A0A0M9FUH6_LEPPY|nr:hypothetical protein ABB37_07695 [Leptomonas pyrrhocoris]KPA76345.1 hypothetical protein ABB37_07695 [Leptomonas pyrrhocoris]|eukprot:XP_015654784.1 hypothetical protein ABB37_07695 [Leptomonas pyrrhocoris]